jgi:hypothetical protein
LRNERSTMSLYRYKFWNSKISFESDWLIVCTSYYFVLIQKLSGGGFGTPETGKKNTWCSFLRVTLQTIYIWWW